MNRLAKEGLLGEIEKVNLPNCEYCLKDKMSKKLFRIGTKVDFLLWLIYSDIYGLMNVRVRHRAYYLLTFKDDYTR